ncbi:MAG: PD-(D/E)XK nuclease family protein [archaeon]
MNRPYSHSSMETFKTCPRKFKYNYIEKPEITRLQSIEAFMGTMVHESLEKLYTDSKFSKLNSLDEILLYYNELWEKKYTPKTIEIIRKDFTSDNYRKLGEDYLSAYYETYKPFNQGKTLGLEHKVTIKVFDPDTQVSHDLTGVIDRLTLFSEDVIEIHDYKTNMVPKTQEQVDEDKQLALYSIAIKQSFPFVKRVDLVWHFLSVGIELRSQRTDLDLDNLRKEVIKIIKDIEEAKKKDQFPTKPSALCDWCEFRSICPATAHDIKLRELPANEFLKDDGVTLVNKYQELKVKKDEYLDKIDKDLENLKEAIIIYSKENNLERLVGSTSSLLIKEYDSIKMPEKGSIERGDLEKLIKATGMWDEVSDLSYFSLLSHYKAGVFSPEFKNRLNQLLTFEKIHRLYLNKK